MHTAYIYITLKSGKEIKASVYFDDPIDKEDMYRIVWDRFSDGKIWMFDDSCVVMSEVVYIRWELI